MLVLQVLAGECDVGTVLHGLDEEHASCDGMRESQDRATKGAGRLH